MLAIHRGAISRHYPGGLTSDRANDAPPTGVSGAKTAPAAPLAAIQIAGEGEIPAVDAVAQAPGRQQQLPAGAAMAQGPLQSAIHLGLLHQTL